MLAVKWLFASLTGPSLAAYLVRGGMALVIFLAGLSQASERPTLGVAIMFMALVPLGGCPMCWLTGTVGAACGVRKQK